MNKYILLFINALLYSICSGQTYTEKIDGNIIVTNKTYFNDSIKKNTSAATDYIGIYQKYISGIRGQECPMYPSCSNYGIKTFSETGFASAFIQTSDRLLRCGHDHDNYSLTLRKNGFKYIDYPAYDNPPSELLYKRNSYYYAYSDTLYESSAFEFIKLLINNQFYQEALLEIMRIEFQKKSFSINLYINKIICLKAIGEYEKALFDYENKCPNEHKTNTELLFQIALIQYKLHNFDQALQKNLLAQKNCSEPLIKPKLLLLNGLLYAKKYDWQNAKLQYKSLGDFESFKQVSDINLKLSEKANELKYKSSTVAGILSIIPGVGYAYTGHKQTALTALLVNGLLTYATYSNIKNENYGMGILTGVFNLSFYIGNIYGSTKSAHRYNEKQKKSIISKLEFNTNF